MNKIIKLSRKKQRAQSKLPILLSIGTISKRSIQIKVSDSSFYRGTDFTLDGSQELFLVFLPGSIHGNCISSFQNWNQINIRTNFTWVAKLIRAFLLPLRNLDISFRKAKYHLSDVNVMKSLSNENVRRVNKSEIFFVCFCATLWNTSLLITNSENWNKIKNTEKNPLHTINKQKYN